MYDLFTAQEGEVPYRGGEFEGHLGLRAHGKVPLRQAVGRPESFAFELDTTDFV
jgi:hypothetical protein